MGENMNNEQKTVENTLKKPYEKPKVVYESKLEVRAGSPLSFYDPLSSITPDYMQEE